MTVFFGITIFLYELEQQLICENGDFADHDSKSRTGGVFWIRTGVICSQTRPEYDRFPISATTNPVGVTLFQTGPGFVKNVIRRIPKPCFWRDILIAGWPIGHSGSIPVDCGES